MAADSSTILSGLRLAGGASSSVATTENRPLTLASDTPYPHDRRIQRPPDCIYLLSVYATHRPQASGLVKGDAGIGPLMLIPAHRTNAEFRRMLSTAIGKSGGGAELRMPQSWSRGARPGGASAGAGSRRRTGGRFPRGWRPENIGGLCQGSRRPYKVAMS